jgi:hypothetical protein
MVLSNANSRQTCPKFYAKNLAPAFCCQQPACFKQTHYSIVDNIVRIVTLQMLTMVDLEDPPPPP